MDHFRERYMAKVMVITIDVTTHALSETQIHHHAHRGA